MVDRERVAGDAPQLSASVSGVRQISMQSVSYRYPWRKHLVLRELTATIQPGITVLLGPNGAGKSTLLRLLAGAIAPKDGTLKLGDRLASCQDLRRVSGLVPQDVPIIAGFTVFDQVRYAAWLKGNSGRASLGLAEDALESMSLTHLRHERVSQLSGGQRRRVGIAQALVNRPEWLLLDEPTVGLDPIQRRDFRSALTGAAARSSVVIATHEPWEMRRMFDSVMLLTAEGLLYGGPAAEFNAAGGALANDVDVLPYVSMVED